MPEHDYSPHHPSCYFAGTSHRHREMTRGPGKVYVSLRIIHPLYGTDLLQRFVDPADFDRDAQRPEAYGALALDDCWAQQLIRDESGEGWPEDASYDLTVHMPSGPACPACGSTDLTEWHVRTPSGDADGWGCPDCDQFYGDGYDDPVWPTQPITVSSGHPSHLRSAIEALT